ncbi:MAG TPA: ABC transporter permease [Bryobacteraceae bacterium]|nr:ABC transporter permease [Bryobacteraceae bacterium]
MSPGELWRRLRFLRKRDRMTEDLDEEMRLHAELRARQLREQGAEAEEANYAARRKFGNRTLLKEASRDMWSFASLDTLWRELKLAARTLRRSPGFTITALLTLALGIGANTAVFSVVDAALLRPLPYPAADRLGQAVIDFKTPTEQGTFSDLDGRTWELLRDHADAIDPAVYSDMTTEANFAAAGHVGYVRQQRVCAGYFRVLGVRPALGREFTRSEDTENGPPVAILSYGFWRNVLQADRSIFDKPLLLRGQPYTIIGVMPPELQTSGGADIWTPLRPSTKGEGADKNYTIIARVKPGATWQKAASQVEALGARRLSEEHDIPPKYKVRIVFLPLQKMMASDLRTPILLLWSAVGVVLLIGCINIAGLLIARGAARTREIGTRMALGGGRAQVVHQLLVESLLLALAAGVAGLAVGWIGLAAIRSVAKESLGLWQAIALDRCVLLASGAVTLLTTVLFGVWPALRASRIDIRAALVEAGTRGVAGLRTVWPRRLLIVGEVALGVMLLAAAGLVVRSFLYLRNQPLGFDPANVTAATLPLQDARYQTSAKINRLFEDTLARIRALPGVESAAAGMCLPYERGLNTMASVPGRDGQDTVLTFVTPDYFRALRIPILRGRPFTAHDDMHSPRVGVVNAFFAKKFFSGADPVGRTIANGGSPMQIVGLVPDIPLKGSLGGYAPVTPIPVIFVPAAQTPDDLFQLVDAWFTPSFVVRSSAPPRDIIAGMQKAIATVDPLLPFSGFHGIMDIRSDTLAQQRFQAAVMAIMAGLALLLAAIGIYGLIAQTVVERTREIGIRIALGATLRQAIRSVAAPGIVLATAGAILGLLAAFSVAPALRHIIWGVRATDPETFAGTAAILLAVAAAASLIPALRIVRLNPAETLRDE